MTLYVAFSVYAARTLRFAMRQLRVQAPMAILADDLAVGPLDPRELDMDFARRTQRFWARVVASRDDVVVCMSSRSAGELCGLLELVWRTGDTTAIRIVDVARADMAGADQNGNPQTFASFSNVRERHIVEGLLDRAQPLTPVQRAAHRDDWARLRAENAPLRILEADRLRSAPVTHFDELILSFVATEWRSGAWIVAHAYGGTRPYRQVSDDFLYGRLLQLVDDGIVMGRCRDDGWLMRDSGFRLPA